MTSRRLPWKVLATLALLALFALSAIAQTDEPFSIDRSPLPPPTAPVNDYAGVLSASAKQDLNRKLNAFKAKTNPSVELAVVIVRSTGGRPIEEYSLAVARGWKIGSKFDDNPGALLFLATDDRKYYTQVSRDLEDELPDGVVGQLQRQYLVPSLRQGNYDKAIGDTIDAYIRTIEHRASPGASPTPSGNTGGTIPGVSFSTLICCAVILIIILLIIFSRSGRSGKSGKDRDRWGGGSGGGGGWIFFPTGGSSSGSSSSWGSSDWGSSSSGSSDWGGFGGGGDFGGGGAGGDW